MVISPYLAQLVLLVYQLGVGGLDHAGRLRPPKHCLLRRDLGNGCEGMRGASRLGKSHIPLSGWGKGRLLPTEKRTETLNHFNKKEEHISSRCWQLIFFVEFSPRKKWRRNDPI